LILSSDWEVWDVDSASSLGGVASISSASHNGVGTSTVGALSVGTSAGVVNLVSVALAFLSVNAVHSWWKLDQWNVDLASLLEGEASSLSASDVDGLSFAVGASSSLAFAWGEDSLSALTL
jgi:hypothetical protein